MRKVLRGCRFITVFTKADLADPRATKRWMSKIKEQGEDAVLFPFGEKKGRAKFISSVAGGSGGSAQQLKAVVVGLPNVGKSTVLNLLTGKKRAKVGASPGVTRGVQLVSVRDDFLVIDTPGVVSSGAADRENGLTLALVGCLQDSFFEPSDAAAALLEHSLPDYSNLLAAHYDLDESFSGEHDFFEAVARRRGFLLKGGVLDLDRVYPLLVKDFSTGRIRGITLEQPV
jgi:ribosome biogenesis GTPase A